MLCNARALREGFLGANPSERQNRRSGIGKGTLTLRLLAVEGKEQHKSKDLLLHVGRGELASHTSPLVERKATAGSARWCKGAILGLAERIYTVQVVLNRMFYNPK